MKRARIFAMVAAVTLAVAVFAVPASTASPPAWAPAHGKNTPTPTPTPPPTANSTPTPTTTSPPVGVNPAASVQEFTSGVCVNTHWTFLDTPYNSGYTTLRDALVDLRITCIRDGWSPADTWMQTRVANLYALGIKFNILIDARLYNDSAADRTEADTNLDGQVSVAEAIDHLFNHTPAGSIISLEGPNELLASNCASAKSQLQQMWAVKQSDPRLANVAILSPSAAAPTEYSCLGDISAYTDDGAIHSYPGSLNPEAQAAGDDWSLAGWKRHVIAAVGSGKPITATETGYHNATATLDGHRPVSETADGKYTAQLPFAYARAGVHRSYKYELVDEFNNPDLTDIQSHFGLMRYDLTEKPSYQSLNNMMDILADSGVTSLTALDYSLTSGTGTVKSLLLQKADGSHWLAVWNDVSVWSGGADLNPSDVSATLAFPSSKTVNIYRPYLSVSVQSTATASSHALSVGVDPILVKIT